MSKMNNAGFYYLLVLLLALQAYIADASEQWTVPETCHHLLLCQKVIAVLSSRPLLSKARPFCTMFEASPAETKTCSCVGRLLTHGCIGLQDAEDRQGRELALKQHRDTSAKLQADLEQSSQVRRHCCTHMARWTCCYKTGTMRFGSTAKVLLKCKLKYYRISE